MLETIRKYIEAGMGAVSNSRAEQIARGFAKQGGAGRDQVSKVAKEIVDWSKKNGDRLVTMVRREVKKQILAMGVASKADIDALKKRVTALESRGSAGGGGSRPTTKSSKTTARKSGAGSTGSGRSTGVTTTGGASGGAPAGARKRTASKPTPPRTTPSGS